MIKRLSSTIAIVLMFFINNYSTNGKYKKNHNTFENEMDQELDNEESMLRKNDKNDDTDDDENSRSTTYFCRQLTNNISKIFSYFNNIDISTRITRIASYNPFFWELDGSTTFRVSFFKLFKGNKLLEHNFIFELNFNKIRDLGGRGFDFLERRLGKNIILDDKDDDDENKRFANGSYFFGLLNKTIIMFSVGVEGRGFYNKLFGTRFIRSGFGVRFPIWSSGIFGLVNNLKIDKDKSEPKDKGCKKWSNLGDKSPLQGIFYNITLYAKPFIYEFDNGFRVDITWENSINDYRYMFYEIKKGKNIDKDVSIFNIYNSKKDRNCFFRTVSFFRNIVFLKLKLEIGFNLTKLI